MATYKDYNESLAYRFYISDSLYYLAEQKRINKHYSEIIADMYKPVDNRTGDEIALEVINKLGLKV